ncbi:winged helix-turn-helix domain-containing tetratricopeptide repeat protein [Castellaniella sp.]|uniref:winged helix-turn-helix domain-containing tetratricopeptide repeat protein n=1 Tax=Castellaniella sp. TaxID=1955812 RepID=UPI003C7239F3
MQWLFADCCLDLERRDLRRASEPVATTPKVFNLLVHLATHRNRVVSRDELIDTVWSGRIVSDSTIASHVNAARAAIGDDGRRQRVIKTVPRLGFRFVADLSERQATPPSSDNVGPSPGSQNSNPEIPGKPSIAVMPFVNLSGDPNQDYLADGVIEEVITVLSQYRWLLVIARNSSFTYKNRNVDVKQIGRELGARYILEGSWRQAQGRVRITGQLVDATTGATHWAGRFEGVLNNLFEFQDDIADSVVGVIAPQLEQAEIARTRYKPTESLNAYDYYLRGMGQLHRGTHDGIDAALPMFRHAFEQDADFASAYAMAAWCYCWRKINGWMQDLPAETAEGAQLARRAIELGKYDAVALARSGHALAHLTGDMVESIALLNQAQALNPNLSAAWFLGAFCHLLHGQAEQAIAHFTRAMRLSPVDPELYRMHVGMAIAHYFMGDFPESNIWAEKATLSMPNLIAGQIVLAASYAMLGKRKEAHRSVARLQEIAPTLSLDKLTDWLPLQNHDDLALLSDGLAKAGFKD